jgi:glucosamine--fructose-6-phosphate aminotransferase (isomerizing)
MNGFPMLENILGQPASHARLFDFHSAEGSASLLACARHIHEARGRVIFSGMGASFFAAIPAVRRLEENGRAVELLESAELLHYGSATLRSDDVAVLISRSGASVEVLRLAEKMRLLGMTVIGVTNLPDTPLQAFAHLTLLIGAQADQLIAVQTYTGTVLTLLLLAEQVAHSNNSRLMELCRASLPMLTLFIEQAESASKGWRGFLHGSEPIHLLGRGPALASVHEGALLLQETAKAAAIPMSSGQFRHGPVETVSSAFRAIVFGSPAATRETDHALAVDLVRMGASVCWIGPQSSDALLTHAELIAWPAIEPELAPIFEIVPLQFAAYQLAQWRGINPGDFRFASEITGSESGFPLLESRLAHS